MHWTMHIYGGPRRVNHAAVAVGDRIFSFGGYCTGDNYKEPGVPIDVFVLNSITYRWTPVQKPQEGDSQFCPWPFQRYGHAVAAFGKKIYLFGGRNDANNCNVLFEFNTKTLTWRKPEVTGDIPFGRDGHTCCVIGNKMYVYGGYEESHVRFSIDVYCLDLLTMHWERLECRGDTPTYRDFHTATAIGNKMYVFGGRSDLSGGWPGQLPNTEFYSNKLYYLDTTTLVWYSPNAGPSSQIPLGRRSHSALNINGQLLIFGGYNGRIDSHFDDLWMFDPEDIKWRQINPRSDSKDIVPNPRRRHAMCRVENKIFIFGGTSHYDGPPIFFTPIQLQLIPEQDSPSSKLIDHNDLFVLDLNPTLKTLCLRKIIALRLPLDGLPRVVCNEIHNMTTDNTISSALKTLPLG